MEMVSKQFLASVALLFSLYNILTVASYNFKLSSSSDNLIKHSDAFENTKSSIRCGMLCAQRRPDDGIQPMCEAYSYDVSNQRCQLYAARANGQDASGVLVYKYHAVDNDPNDGFDYVTAWGQTFIYYVSDNSMDFGDAGQHCRGLGAYLVNFDSSEEYDTFRSIYIADKGWKVGTRVWVGAQDIHGDWVTDRHGIPIDFSIWKFDDGEPSNHGGVEDCAIYSLPTERLNDVECRLIYNVACERTP